MCTELGYKDDTWLREMFPCPRVKFCVSLYDFQLAIASVSKWPQFISRHAELAHAVLEVSSSKSQYERILPARKLHSSTLRAAFHSMKVPLVCKVGEMRLKEP